MDGGIDDLPGIADPHNPEILPDSVCYDDGVVQGIANNRQQSRQNGQIKRPLEQRKHPQDDDHIVGQRHHRCDAKLELKAHADIDQHHRQCQQQAQATVFLQLFADLRADELGADELEVGSGLPQRPGHFQRQLVVTGFREPD